MDFTNSPPEWQNSGEEPSQGFKESGFNPGYKPPAAYFNWFWSKVSKCLSEIQNKLSDLDNNKASNAAVATKAEAVYNEGFIGGQNAGLLSTGGAAVGAGAKASKGLAGGKNASAAEGAAIGSEASASHGVAAGRNAKTLHGAALGDGAKTVDEEGNPITAVQLGEGTNSDPNTFRVFSYQMMDAKGQIPEARLTSAVGGKVKLPESVFVIYASGSGGFYHGTTSGYTHLINTVRTSYGDAQFGAAYGFDTVSVTSGPITLTAVIYLNSDNKLCWDEYYGSSPINDYDGVVFEIITTTAQVSSGSGGYSYNLSYFCNGDLEDAFIDEEQYIPSEAITALALRMKALQEQTVSRATYSTTPQRISTWIDGRPVYRQAFQQKSDGYSVRVFLQNADNYLKVIVLNARCLLRNSTNDNFVWTNYDIGGDSTSAYIEFAESSKPSGAATAYGYVDYTIESEG